MQIKNRPDDRRGSFESCPGPAFTTAAAMSDTGNHKSRHNNLPRLRLHVLLVTPYSNRFFTHRVKPVILTATTGLCFTFTPATTRCLLRLCVFLKPHISDRFRLLLFPVHHAAEIGVSPGVAGIDTNTAAGYGVNRLATLFIFHDSLSVFPVGLSGRVVTT